MKGGKEGGQGRGTRYLRPDIVNQYLALLNSSSASFQF